MKSITTIGLICIKDNLNLEYNLVKIEYILNEDETFEYRFYPFYHVIELLDSTIFQGIPGLNLELKKQVYVRSNKTPVFISERAPSKARENLYEMLESVGMDYLNPLEWLIRTNLMYSGDNMYVKSYEECKSVSIPLKNDMNTNSLLKSILTEVCKGNDVSFGDFIINDTNRKEIHYLLSKLYEKGRIYQYQKMKEGIEKSKLIGKYKGRKAIEIDDTEIYEFYKKYRRKTITLNQVLEHLGISKATFYRRIKEIKSAS